MAKSKKFEATGTLDIGGVSYPWRSPKLWFYLAISRAMQADALSDEQAMALFDLQIKFLRAGLSKKSWAAVEDRLNDPDDTFDVTDLSEAIVRAFGVEDSTVPSS